MSHVESNLSFTSGADVGAGDEPTLTSYRYESASGAVYTASSIEEAKLKCRVIAEMAENDPVHFTDLMELCAVSNAVKTDKNETEKEVISSLPKDTAYDKNTTDKTQKKTSQPEESKADAHMQDSYTSELEDESVDGEFPAKLESPAVSSDIKTTPVNAIKAITFEGPKLEKKSGSGKNEFKSLDSNVSPEIVKKETAANFYDVNNMIEPIKIESQEAMGQDANLTESVYKNNSYEVKDDQQVDLPLKLTDQNDRNTDSFIEPYFEAEIIHSESEVMAETPTGANSPNLHEKIVVAVDANPEIFFGPRIQAQEIQRKFHLPEKGSETKKDLASDEADIDTTPGVHGVIPKLPPILPFAASENLEISKKSMLASSETSSNSLGLKQEAEMTEEEKSLSYDSVTHPFAIEIPKIIPADTTSELEIIKLEDSPIPLPEIEVVSFENIRGAIKELTVTDTFGLFIKFLASETTPSIELNEDKTDVLKQEHLSQIMTELKLTLLQSTKEGEEDIRRKLTPEMTEKTLVLFSFLGYEKPEEALEKFMDEQSEETLVKTLEFMTKIYESGQRKEQDLDEGFQNVDEEVLEVYSQLYTLSLSETQPDEIAGGRQDVEYILETSIEEAIDRDKSIDFISLVEAESIDEPAESFSEIGLSNNGQMLPLEKTLAKVAGIPVTEKGGVVGQIDLLELVDELKSELDAEKAQSQFTPEITEKTIQLLRFLGYDNPGEALIGSVKEHGTGYVLEMLRDLCEIESMKKRKFETMLWAISINPALRKPLLEVQVPGINVNVVFTPTL